MRVEDRAIDLDAKLDEYEASIGLPAFSFAQQDEDAKSIMQMSRSQIRKMTATECGESAFILNRFSSNVQRALNREQQMMEWCEENIHRIIAKTVADVKGYKYEERRPLAILSDDVAVKFDKLRVAAKSRVNRLKFLSNSIQNMARSLDQLQMSKRGSRE